MRVTIVSHLLLHYMLRHYKDESREQTHQPAARSSSRSHTQWPQKTCLGCRQHLFVAFVWDLHHASHINGESIHGEYIGILLG